MRHNTHPKLKHTRSASSGREQVAHSLPALITRQGRRLQLPEGIPSFKGTPVYQSEIYVNNTKFQD